MRTNILDKNRTVHLNDPKSSKVSAKASKGAIHKVRTPNRYNFPPPVAPFTIVGPLPPMHTYK